MTTKKWMLTFFVFILLIALGVGLILIHPMSKKPVHKTIPPFTAVVPLDEAQLAHLGKKNYDAAHNTYTYFDYYLALPIQVSEAPLPTNDGSVANTVKDAAHSFQANQTFETTYDGLAYMTTKPSPAKQIVVFTEKGLLIFIETATAQNTSYWNGYINSLQ